MNDYIKRRNARVAAEVARILAGRNVTVDQDDMLDISTLPLTAVVVLLLAARHAERVYRDDGSFLGMRVVDAGGNQMHASRVLRAEAAIDLAKNIINAAKAA